MRLFTIPEGQRVRVTSRLIRWVEHGSESRVAEDVTWEGTTTNRYFYYKGYRRRLIIDHTLNWPEYGVWQKDIEVELTENRPLSDPPQRLRHGVLVDE